MGDNFKADYSNHAFRSYFSANVHPDLSKAEKSNTEAVLAVLRDLTDEQLSILQTVYQGPRRPMPEAVAEAAEIHQLDFRIIWRLIRDVTRRFANARGL